MYLFKIGGAAGLNNIDNFLKDFAEIQDKKILVHGASAQRNELAAKLNLPIKTITSISGIESVRTDSDSIDLIMMAYSGLTNKKIVEKLQKLNVNAIGLSGIDGGLLRGERKKAIKAQINDKKILIRDDLSGKTNFCNTKLLNLLLENDYTVVISIPILSYENEAINTDNDTMTAVIAKEMKIDTVVYFSDVPGLLEDFENKNSLIKEIRLEDIKFALNAAQGRMKKKILGAKDCLENGIKKVIFADGRKEHPIKSALNGEGTVFIV